MHEDPSDGRRRIPHPTAAGEGAWNELDRRSDEIAHHIVDPLTDAQRAELADALKDAQRLVRLTSIELIQVAADSAAAMSAMRAYVAELDERFPENFDIANGFEPDVLAQMSAPHGAFIVVDDDGEALGCGGVRRIDPTTAEIKRMWLHPSMRGLGLGKRLLARLEAAAVDLGVEAVVLDTNGVLDEAIAMYESSGYERIDRYNDNPYAQLFFRKRVG